MLRYLAEQQVVSLLDHSTGFWLAKTASGLKGTSTLRAYLNFAVDRLAELRDGAGWESEYKSHIWPLARLGLAVSRRARFDFRDIDPAWLRELIK